MNINWSDIGNTFEVRVTPKSSFNRIKYDQDSKTIRIYVTSAPEDGKANDAVIKLLSEEMKVAKSQISIIRGQTSRNKTISIRR
jgi:uncharacterized protein